MSAQDGLDFCRLLWYEITVGTLNLEEPSEAIAAVDGAFVSDCKSFYGSVNRKESAGLGMRDKRAAIEALSVRQHSILTGTPVFWCHSDAQLADGLTKPAAAWKLEEFFDRRGQVWRLTFDPQMLSAKRRRTLRLGPLEDAIEDLAPAEMLAAKKSDKVSPLHDDRGRWRSLVRRSRSSRACSADKLFS